jgi:hypothetical protein
MVDSVIEGRKEFLAGQESAKGSPGAGSTCLIVKL